VNICVIDVGTSSIRSAVTDGHRVSCFRQQRTPPNMPEPGLVEFDANEMAAVILQSATEVVEEVGGVDAVAVVRRSYYTDHTPWEITAHYEAVARWSDGSRGKPPVVGRALLDPGSEE